MLDVSTIKDNPFAGKTATEPRPSRDASRHRFLDDAELRRRQKQWDDAQAWARQDDEMRAAHLAKVEAEKRAEVRARADEDAARRTAERDQLVARLRSDFLRQPGATEADWEHNKDAVVDDHFRRQMAANDEAARRAHGTIYREL